MSHTYQKHPLLPKANPPKSSHQVYEEPFTSHMHTQKRIVGNKCWCGFCSSLVRNCYDKTTLTKNVITVTFLMKKHNTDYF